MDSCENFSSEDNIKIQIKGGTTSNTKALYFQLPPTAYMVPGSILNLESSYCYFGITGMGPSKYNAVIIGDVFLKHFYTIYD